MSGVVIVLDFNLDTLAMGTGDPHGRHNRISAAFKTDLSGELALNRGGNHQDFCRLGVDEIALGCNSSFVLSLHLQQPFLRIVIFEIID